MENIKIKINGTDVEAPVGSTILEAARLAQIDIPTLCYLKDLNEIGACRICVVKVEGVKGLVASCVYPVRANMEIWTNTSEVIESRRQSLDLICSNHRMDCEKCVRYTDCELQALCREYGVEEKNYSKDSREPDCDDSAIHLVRDKSKCILCRRCVATCKNQCVGAIGVFEHGMDTHIGSALPLADTSCVNCGQCITVCPVGALYERDDTSKVWKALSDPSKHVVAAVSPYVYAELGESFFEPIGTNVAGKTIAVLRRMGFDRVFDMKNIATVSIMEGSAELLDRLAKKGKLPLITSWCPSWVKFCETYYPHLVENLSTCKSPQGMFGALCKSFYAEQLGIDPKDIFVVSIEPCTAKKFECQRPELASKGYPDVDVSLTTRELANMIRQACVSRYTSLKVWKELPNEKSDSFFGTTVGSWPNFGTTGGLMEAILHAADEKTTAQESPIIVFNPLQGSDTIKEAEMELAGTKIKVAVVSGFSDAVKLLDMVQSGAKDYTFIEIMACPGGCVNGGGQPRQPGSVHNFTDLNGDRAKALEEGNDRKEDVSVNLPFYQDYMDKLNDSERQTYLHTHYTKRNIY